MLISNLPEVDARIQVVRADIRTVVEGVVIHCCNDQGKMGAGVALAIRMKWPKAYEAYRRAYNSGRLTLSSTTGALVEPDLLIVNAVMQHGYGNDGTCRIIYPCIQHCFARIVDLVSKSRVNNSALREVPFLISFPLLGCGLAGGEWPRVQEQILLGTPPHWKLRLYLK